MKYPLVYTINRKIFQVFTFPWLVVLLILRWYWLFFIITITTSFHVLTFINSPLRLFRFVSNTFKKGEDSEIVTSGDESEIDEEEVSYVWKFYQKFELENYINFVWQLGEDLMNFIEFQHYLFDRYVAHAPFCVLKKFKTLDTSSGYTFRNIKLTKYEGYTHYLQVKKEEDLERELINNSSSIYQSSPEWSIKKKKKPKKGFKVDIPPIIPPNNKISKTLPMKPSKYQNRKKKSLIDVRKQVTKVIEFDPKLTLAGNEGMVNEKLTKLPTKEEIINDKETQLSSSPVSAPPPSRESVLTKKHKLHSPSIPDIEKSILSSRAKLTNKWNQMIKQDKFKSNKFVIPYDTSQIFSTNNKKLREINIKLPNNQSTQLRLKIVKKPASNLTLIKSIDPNDWDYVDKVSAAISKIFPREGYDDGSLAPIILRLAWHCCATYDKATGLGGSNGATMRFLPEMIDEGNTGLDIARSALEPIKQQFTKITYSDLWTLAGKVAIEHMGGPEIPWKCGRFDCINDKFVPKNGNLPFAAKDANHVRTTFERMGFDDQEMVALVGAHSIGRCHKKFSGWEGKWTKTPTIFTNEFFVLLFNETWTLDKVPETGRSQYYNPDKTLMMLNTDMELIRDSQFYKWVKVYAESESRYMNDFSLAFGKLLELGITRDESDQVLPKF